jgi:replicative DNA helicase
VVIDYLGLIKETHLRQHMIEKTSEITRTLKQVALAEDIAIILLAQMTREGRKAVRGSDGQAGMPPVPRMEDLLGGSSIEADADGIVFLHPLQTEGDERRIDAIVAKNRRGPFPVSFPLWFFGKYQYFQDSDPAPIAHNSRSARLQSAPDDAEQCF